MSSFESTCFQGLAILRSSSSMLRDVKDDELEAQMLLNQAKSSTAMEASRDEHELVCNEFLCFHVQRCSIIAQDDESTKEKWLWLKKFGEKSEREFWDFENSRSRIGNCDEFCYD